MTTTRDIRADEYDCDGSRTLWGPSFGAVHVIGIERPGRGVTWDAVLDTLGESLDVASVWKLADDARAAAQWMNAHSRWAGEPNYYRSQYDKT
ncbi:hypothetical protein C3477_24670 [Mycobacterium kansasii]|uniref:hypothetical protein n=1 Tax=Mycobacterium kansasii TaxID=1768 RepID=UPI000CDD92F5|nr:hypothetical protein [Mycobacterium kansasii]POX92236.1 hypothetical protein C3B43_00350 [Mycobacterium kansasii]POX97975.1 hypothetical protein C3477_24670 [Mycobacterium kansasii]POY24450.1 hypothetical protein C3476_04310 [Mycobacterium kansasii]